MRENGFSVFLEIGLVGMLLPMEAKLASLPEGISTRWVFANVWLLASVDVGVLIQVLLKRESFRAIGASEGLIWLMGELMSFHAKLGAEFLFAALK